MKLINLNDNIPEKLKYDIGIKALNLSILSGIDYVTVPDGFVIPISVLRKVENGSLDLRSFSVQILKRCNILFGESFSGSVAVRSSSPYEDSENKSYAGQYLTRLNVSADSIIEDVFDVYHSQSLISDYSLDETSEVAVIIQKMIQPDFSGILFTKNPNDSAEALIEYDDSLLDEFISGNSQGAGRLNVSRSDIVNLDENNVFNKIFQIGLKLERELGYYCDIEWAVQNSEIFILQVRPITTLGQIKVFLGNENHFDSWTSGNVGEVLPGEMSILSWSMFGEMINDLLRQSFKFLSNSYSVNDICFIRLENNKLLYNLGAINYFTNEILGFPKMDEIVGGDNTEWSDIDYSMNWKKIFKNIKVILSNNKLFDKLPSESDKAYLRIEHCVKELKSKDFSTYSTDDLVEQFLELKTIISKEMFLHTEATSASFSLVSILKYILKQKNLPDALLTELLSNINGVKIAELIPKINRLKKLVPDSETQTIIEILKQDNWSILLRTKGFLELELSIQALIEEFGHRGNSELELATPTWGEESSEFLHMIASLWIHTAIEDTRVVDIEKIIKDNAMLNSQNKLYLFILKKVVKKARLFTRYRENNKHFLYLLVYQLRRIISEFKNRVPELYHKCFYNLTEEELLFLVTSDFYVDIESIERRSNLMKANKQPYLKKDLQSCSDIKGLSASVGIVEGKVRVIDSIKDINDIKENEILVTKSIDIGWTPVFPIVKGIITEIGGVLSHASIIARELSVPAVVNVENATKILATGEKVLLDANSGIIIRKSRK